MTRAAEAFISTSALRHNLERINQTAPQSKITAIIKANGYGHGIVRVAQALEQRVAAFGVASIEEALTLRESGIAQNIILLAGFFEPGELQIISNYKFSMAIHSQSQIDILERVTVSMPIPVWLKIDTGMHRLGVPAAMAENLWRRLMACSAVAKPIGFMTHLASADDLSSQQTQEQLECFKNAVGHLPGERSIANSAGLLAWTQTRSHCIRPGLALYGVSPFAETTATHYGLQPVMTLRSRLMAINLYKQNDSIGYNATWTCPEDMPVGVVAIGYGDGYPRHAKIGTPVLIRGVRVPLVGRVSMDTICVDLRPCPSAEVGDSVTLWGQGLPVEEIAHSANTIPYELLCKVTPRVKFVEENSSTC